MAGSFKKLYQQSFTDSSNITVTHNQNKIGLGVMVTSASIARPDIINYIKFTPGNERNQFILNLTAQSSGEVLVIESDYMWTNTPVPEVVQALSGSYMEAGGNVILSTPGSILKIPRDSIITGSLNVTTNITSSGNISASGYIVGKMYDRQVGYTGSIVYTSGGENGAVTCSKILTTGDLGGNGDYMIYFNIDWDNDSDKETNTWRLKKNGVVMPYAQFYQWNTKNTDDEIMHCSFQYFAPDIPAGTVFDVDMYNSTGNEDLTAITSSLIIDGIPTLSNIS